MTYQRSNPSQLHAKQAEVGHLYVRQGPCMEGGMLDRRVEQIQDSVHLYPKKASEISVPRSGMSQLWCLPQLHCRAGLFISCTFAFTIWLPLNSTSICMGWWEPKPDSWCELSIAVTSPSRSFFLASGNLLSGIGRKGLGWLHTKLQKPGSTASPWSALLWQQRFSLPSPP